MSNYELLTKETLVVTAIDCGEEIQHPHFDGASTSTYIVTNPDWNIALNDTARHAPFQRYMEQQLSCTDIQWLTKGKDGRFTFSALEY